MDDFYFVERFHGRRCAVCCKAGMNFADESGWLTADNVRNEEKFLPLLRDYRSADNAVPLYTQTLLAPAEEVLIYPFFI
jgi:hypothetical protein